MSDFFGHLAARTAETPPAIQPRMPALFEADQPEQTEHHEIVAALLVPARWQQPVQAHQPGPTAAPEWSLPRPTQAPPAPLVSTPVAPRPAAPPPAPGTPEDRPARQQPVAALPHQPDVAQRTTIQITNDRVPQSAPQSERLASIAAPTAAPQPPLDLPRQTAPLAPAPIVIVQPLSPPALPDSPRTPQIETSTAQPIIHVSIGRVEVRAVPQQPARTSGESRSRPSVMSLDEYLRSREGRR